MAMFEYKAATTAGEVVNGVLSGSTRLQVIEQLQSLGHVPIRVDESAARESSVGKRQFQWLWISTLAGEPAILHKVGVSCDLKSHVDQHIDYARVYEGDPATLGLAQYIKHVVHQVQVTQIVGAIQSQVVGKQLNLVTLTSLDQKERKLVDKFDWVPHLSSEERLESALVLEALKLRILLHPDVSIGRQPLPEAMLELIHGGTLLVFVNKTRQLCKNSCAHTGNIWIL